MQQRILRVTLIPLVLIFGLAMQHTGSVRAATLPIATRHYLSQVYWNAPTPNRFAARPQANLPGNFPFQTVTSADGLVAVHYYSQSADFAQQVITQIAGYVQHPVKDTLGYGLKSLANIYLYNSRADFLVGTNKPDSQEIGAFTMPSTSSIYMPIYENGTNVISYYLPHELTHLVFHQINDSGHVKDELRFYPNWLDEGMAASDELAGGDGVLQYEGALAQFPFQNIFTEFVNDYPPDPNVDLMCYAEARTFILFLEKTYGITAFHQFIADLHVGDYNLAMEEAFGADLQTIHSNWQVTLGQPALKHDGGQPLATPIVQPYQPLHLSGSAVQSTLTPIDGQEQFIGDALSRGLLITLLGLLGAAGGWLLVFLQRRRAGMPPAAPASVPVPYQAYGPPPTSGYPPTYGPAAAPNYPPPYGPPVTPSYRAPYGTAATPDGPSFHSPPAAAYLPISEVETQVMTASRSKARPSYPWVTLAIAALVAPLVLVIETAWPTFAPTLEWSAPYRVAAAITALAGVALLGLGIFAVTRKGVNVAHGVGLFVAILLTVGAIAQVRTLGLAQGKAYEQNNNLTLARQLELSNGASGKDGARIDATWAEQALHFGDYATGITHLRAALAENPHDAQAQTWSTELAQTVDKLGTALIAAQNYGPAEQTYHDQAQVSTCDAACKTTMQQGGSQALLAWARDLLTRNQASDAKGKLQLVVTRYGQSDGGKSATRVLAAQGDPLKAAIAAAGANDPQAASILALMAYLQQPNTLTAIQASEVSTPVTGNIAKANGTSITGEQVFFLGFTSKAAATTTLTTAQTDESVIKVLATIGDGGNYTVQLPPGYWYTPLWDDPTQGNNYYFNYSRSPDSGVFFVTPFFTNTGGAIRGA